MPWVRRGGGGTSGGDLGGGPLEGIESIGVRRGHGGDDPAEDCEGKERSEELNDEEYGMSGMSSRLVSFLMGRQGRDALLDLVRKLREGEGGGKEEDDDGGGGGEGERMMPPGWGKRIIQIGGGGGG